MSRDKLNLIDLVAVERALDILRPMIFQSIEEAVKKEIDKQFRTIVVEQQWVLRRN